MARKSLALAYALCAYVLALANLVYIIGFLTDIGVPKGISDGPEISVWLAVLIDMTLIGLFGLHHSFTARTSFKRWWTKIVPAPIERATYLYMTSITTALLIIFWQPIPVTIWQVESTWAIGLIYTAYLAIWGMMFAATFHFGHFGFFGLAQAWQNFRQSFSEPSGMTARYLYALVRHPISLGWMITPLVTPHLTVGHVTFSVATVIYVMLATPFEEADLIDALGQPYLDYRKRVPAFVPRLNRQQNTEISNSTD
ncbi:MAG: hypothetical protein K8F25_07445 [Fimbriimonadaceae bacterium]|nr:hypothetical protein [Alphaproteobacteria bacterium]